MKTIIKSLAINFIIVTIFMLVYLFFNNAAFAENIYREGYCKDHLQECQPGTCTDYATLGGSRFGCQTPYTPTPPIPTPTLAPNQKTCENYGNEDCRRQGLVCTPGISVNYICVKPSPTPTPTAVPVPTNTPTCSIVDKDFEGRCISCTEISVPQKNSCTGGVTGYVTKASSSCGASDACSTGYSPAAPTAVPRAPTVAARAPAKSENQGNQNQAAPQVAADTTCEGTLDMVAQDGTCEYKSTWKMSDPEGDGKCEVWIRSAVSGELTQMDNNGTPFTDCNAQVESRDFKLNSGEDFDLVISNGKSECTNKVVASKKCEASASKDSSGGDEAPIEEQALIIGPAIDDNKCTDQGFEFDTEYGQCGGFIHNSCEEANDGKAGDNEELVVRRYKNADGEVRYLTQSRGKTPGVCGNLVPTPRPTQSSKDGGSAACKIGSQSPSVSDACAQCIGMAQHVKPMDPDKFNVCSDTQVTNYWCNGGISDGAKNDCAEAKQNKCAAQCRGTASSQPTNTPAPEVPTATPGVPGAGLGDALPEGIKKSDIAEPIGCIGTPDLRAVAVGVGEGKTTTGDLATLNTFYRSLNQVYRKFLCSELNKNP